MAFMKLELARKGALYTCECDNCGATLYSHEWVHDDHNDRRVAMQTGKLSCDQCHGKTNPELYQALGRHWAGRYSADGYLDCTDWEFDKNRRRLEKTLRDMYGED